MLDPFSDEYRDSVKEKKQAAYEAFVNSVNARYEKLLAQNERDIALMEKNAALLDTALTMSKSSLESNVEIYSKQLNEYDAQIVSAEAEGRSTIMLSAERAQLLMRYTVLSDILSGDDERSPDIKNSQMNSKHKPPNTERSLKSFLLLRFMSLIVLIQVKITGLFIMTAKRSISFLRSFLCFLYLLQHWSA